MYYLNVWKFDHCHHQITKLSDQFFDSKRVHLILDIKNIIFLFFLSIFIFFNFFDFNNLKFNQINLWKNSSFEINEKLKFTSNMVLESDLSYGFYRLLSTDNNVILPYNCFIRMLITSLDVLHSWAVPSLGIKLDACPGRLSQTMIFMKREGFFYGQCSEICGINHAFMPIVIESVDIGSYSQWLANPLPTLFNSSVIAKNI